MRLEATMICFCLARDTTKQKKECKASQILCSLTDTHGWSRLGIRSIEPLLVFQLDHEVIRVSKSNYALPKAIKKEVGRLFILNKARRSECHC